MSPWSLWVRVPAYAAGIVVFGWLLILAVNDAMSPRAGDAKRPWLGWVKVLLIIVAAYSYVGAWTERNVLYAFAENMLAHLLYFGVPAAAIGAGAVVGIRLDRWWNRPKYQGTPPNYPRLRWASWSVGIVIAVTVLSGGSHLARMIPGVGDKFQRIIDQPDRDDDYRW